MASIIRWKLLQNREFLRGFWAFLNILELTEMQKKEEIYTLKQL